MNLRETSKDKFFFKENKKMISREFFIYLSENKITITQKTHLL